MKASLLSIKVFILLISMWQFLVHWFYKGTSDLPRISCANHKLNLAIKTAIREHKTIERHFRILNNFISKIKKTIHLNRLFANAKCRLRLENITRWGSGFLMLEIKKEILRIFCFKSLVLFNVQASAAFIERFFDYYYLNLKLI